MDLNLSPEMMAAMQEQVAKMSPAQLEAMMAATRGVDMGAAQAAAAAHLASATPEDIRRAGEAMSSATPEAMTAGMAQAGARLKYEVDASARLKTEGNTAFAKGDSAAAAAAWSRAADNLKAHTSPEAVALRRALRSNLALAHLKLGDFAAAETAASAVLAEEPGNAKCLLRRGTARLEVGKKEEDAKKKKADLKRALADLKGALAGAAPGDKGTVAAVVADAEAALEAAAVACGEGDGEVEEEDEEDEVVPAPAPSPAAPFAFPPGGMPGGLGSNPAAQAAQMRAFAAALRADPGLKEKVAATAAGMGPAQLAAAAKAAGVDAPPPEALTPGAMAAAADAMAGMTPEQLEAMASAIEAQSGGGGASTSAAAAPSLPTFGGPGAPPPPGDVSALLKDPAMLKQAAAMMKAMPAETLAAMSGGAISTEAAEAMKEKLGGMSEETLAKVMGAAQRMQALKERVLAIPPWAVWAIAAVVVAVVGRALGWL